MKLRSPTEGDTQTESFRIGVDWLNDKGEYMATSDIYGLFLDPGEQWIARTPAWLDVENPENIGSAEATVAELDPWGDMVANPDGIQLEDQTVRASEQEVVVRGVVKNNRQTTTFINAGVKVADANGTVLAINDTIKEVASGDTWRFEVNPNTYGRNSQVDSATVIPYITR